MAAVIGQEAPLELWRAVAAMPEEDLLVAEQAVAARILDEVPDGTRVRFHHALMRAALYESVSALRWRAWHHRVADTLLAWPTPDPDAVAYHLQQAGDPRAGD